MEILREIIIITIQKRMLLQDIILELKIYLGEKSAMKTIKNTALKIIFIIIKMELKKTASQKILIRIIIVIIITIKT